MKEKSMYIYTSQWMNHPSFKLLPTTKDCPYLELIYCPVNKILHCVLKHTQQTLRFLPKLSEKGDFIRMKAPRLYRNTESPYEEERRLVENAAEFIIENPKEVENFILRFAENTDFDFKKYLDAPPANAQPTAQVSPEQQIASLNALVEGAKEHGAELSIVKE